MIQGFPRLNETHSDLRRPQITQISIELVLKSEKGEMKKHEPESFLCS
jgi:hypothetical protein